MNNEEIIRVEVHGTFHDCVLPFILGIIMTTSIASIIIGFDILEFILRKFIS